MRVRDKGAKERFVRNLTGAEGAAPGGGREKSSSLVPFPHPLGWFGLAAYMRAFGTAGDRPEVCFKPARNIFNCTLAASGLPGGTLPLPLPVFYPFNG
jgi:hypothetical protein